MLDILRALSLFLTRLRLLLHFTPFPPFTHFTNTNLKSRTLKQTKKNQVRHASLTRQRSLYKTHQRHRSVSSVNRQQLKFFLYLLLCMELKNELLKGKSGWILGSSIREKSVWESFNRNCRYSQTPLLG